MKTKRTTELVPLLQVAIALGEPDYMTRRRAQRGEFPVEVISGRYYVTVATIEDVKHRIGSAPLRDFCKQCGDRLTHFEPSRIESAGPRGGIRAHYRCPKGHEWSTFWGQPYV